MIGDYHRALFTMHDRHERITGLLDVHERLSAEDFWPLFRHVWDDSESYFLHGAALREMLTTARLEDPIRFVSMERLEHAFLMRSARRDKPVKVYRGGCQLNLTGFSWTTRKSVAEKAAQKSGSMKPLLTTGRVPVDRIVMYLSNDSSEIVAFPEHVNVEAVADIPPLSTQYTNARRLQIAVQSKGANAVQQLTPAEYFANMVEHGDMDRKALLDHMKASRDFLEPLGFKTRLVTVNSIIEALEK